MTVPLEILSALVAATLTGVGYLIIKLEKLDGRLTRVETAVEIFTGVKSKE